MRMLVRWTGSTRAPSWSLPPLPEANSTCGQEGERRPAGGRQSLGVAFGTAWPRRLRPAAVALLGRQEVGPSTLDHRFDLPLPDITAERQKHDGTVKWLGRRMDVRPPAALLGLPFADQKQT